MIQRNSRLKLFSKIDWVETSLQWLELVVHPYKKLRWRRRSQLDFGKLLDPAKAETIFEK